MLLSNSEFALSKSACSRLTGTASPKPVMVFYIVIVAASTCFVRKKDSKHLFGRLLAKRDLTFSDRCLHPKEHCVNVFHSCEPSSAPNRNSSGGDHPHMSAEFPSPVQENTLQAKHVRCRTHQPILFRFTRAVCNTACPLQYVQTVLFPNINAQPETLFLVRMQPAWSMSGFGTHDTLLPLE